MPEISRPKVQTAVQSSRLSTSQPVGGAIAVGQAQQNLGNLQASMANEFFQAAQKSFKESIYNDAISESTQKMNRAYEERLSQRTDKDGNPTYMSLGNDIEAIAKQIQEDQRNRIIDPDAAKKFDADFTRYKNSKVNQSFAAARQQHIDYSRASLGNSLQTIQEEAAKGGIPNINDAIHQANTAIANAAQGGVLSQQEAEQQMDVVTANIRVGAYSRFIDTNPMEGLAELQKSSEELGISENEHRKLTKYAKAAVRDQQVAAQRIQREQEKAIREQQALVTGEMELGIIKDTIGEREIEEQEDLGNITPSQRIKLLKQLERRRQSKEKEAIVGGQIDDVLEAGTSLHDFSSKQVKEHYLARVKAASPTDESTGESKPISMGEKAKIAAEYTRPISSFQNELEFNLKHGDPEAALDALSATSFVEKKQSVALERMDPKSRAIAGMAISIIENTDTDANRAIEIARQSVLDKDDTILKERSANFSSIKEFQRKNMKETVKELFDLDSTFGFGGKELAPGTAERMRDMLRQAYLQTGDSKAAMRTVKQQVQNTYGVSEFNEKKGIFDDTEIFMFMPPEKAFPGVPVEELKADLSQSLEDWLNTVNPEQDPQGLTQADLTTMNAILTEDSVRIQSDELTRANPNQISYSLYTVNEFGQEIPLIDQNGQPLRWSPDYKGLANKKIQAGVESARMKRQEAIDEAQRVIQDASSSFRQTLQELE